MISLDYLVTHLEAQPQKKSLTSSRFFSFPLILSPSLNFWGVPPVQIWSHLELLEWEGKLRRPANLTWGERERLNVSLHCSQGKQSIYGLLLLLKVTVFCPIIVPYSTELWVCFIHLLQKKLRFVTNNNLLDRSQINWRRIFCIHSSSNF